MSKFNKILKISEHKRKTALMNNPSYKIAALYRFTPVDDIPAMRAAIYEFGEAHTPSMCGTLLIAPEGINGTIGAHPDELDAMVAYLDEQFGINQGELKYSEAAKKPFNKFKVRPKKELITLRKPEADPNKLVGQYVAPEDWNDLINDPDVVLVDTRNEYETRVGIFEGAIDPGTDVFTEFPEWVEKNLDPAKDKKVAMYCTGGIRCEKASAYMLAHGFENVYHLKGGILKYLETVPADKSKWQGECFVFDQRVSVRHGLEEGDWDVCHGCREPLAAADLERAEYERGVSCHHCFDNLTEDRIAALRQRHAHFMKNQEKQAQAQEKTQEQAQPQEKSA